MENVATAFLLSQNAQLEDYEGYCGELVNDILNSLNGVSNVSILHLEGVNKENLQSITGYEWNYHMVLVIDGMIHDAWHPDVVPVGQYLLNFTNSDIQTDYYDVVRNLGYHTYHLNSNISNT